MQEIKQKLNHKPTEKIKISKETKLLKAHTDQSNFIAEVPLILTFNLSSVANLQLQTKRKVVQAQTTTILRSEQATETALLNTTRTEAVSQQIASLKADNN
jgi:hypothetical protein